MPDYTKALHEGFEAAKKAAAARKEIKEVLGIFKEQVLAASEGKLLIELQELEEPHDPVDVFKSASVFGRPQPKKFYQALVSSNPLIEKSSSYQLARWKQSRSGYPCSLSFGQQEHQFEDRSALEEGLAELLSDPRTGEVLYKLANQVGAK